MSANVDELVDSLLTDLPPATTSAQQFLGEQFDRGLAWVHYPEGSGGLGLTPKDQQRAQSRLHAGGAPVAALKNPIGYGMCAPTIVTHGSLEQKQRYLRPLVVPGRQPEAARPRREVHPRQAAIELLPQECGGRRGRRRAVRQQAVHQLVDVRAHARTL